MTIKKKKKIERYFLVSRLKIVYQKNLKQNFHFLINIF